MAEQKCYLFVGCDGRTTVEHYVEHNDSSLPSRLDRTRATAARRATISDSRDLVRIEGVRDADMPSQAMQDVIDTSGASRRPLPVSPRPPWNSAAPRFAPAGRLHPLPERRGVTDVTAGGVPAHWLAAPGADTGRVLLFLHDGVTSSVRCAATGSWPPGWDGPAGCGCCSPNTGWPRASLPRRHR